MTTTRLDMKQVRREMEVMSKAEAVILDPSSTPERIQMAINDVDALSNPEASRAIRRTLQHEKMHRAEGR